MQYCKVTYMKTNSVNWNKNIQIYNFLILLATSIAVLTAEYKNYRTSKH